MNKRDLKAGYTLLDERGRYWYLFPTKMGLVGTMIDEEGKIIQNQTLSVKEALNEDLTLSKTGYNPNCNIVAVYSHPNYLHHLTTAEFKEFPLLWKRKKTKKVFRMWKFIATTFLSTEQVVLKFKSGEVQKYEGLTSEEILSKYGVIVYDMYLVEEPIDN